MHMFDKFSAQKIIFTFLPTYLQLLFSRPKWIHTDGEMCIFFENVWSVGNCQADQR
jgi:hypothetical protein